MLRTEAIDRRTLIARFSSALLGAASGVHPLGALAQVDGDTDVPYVITPQNVVDAMLELASVGPNDRLIDLGSGDGRIVVTAARRWGIAGLGIEIDPSLVATAQAHAQRAGVAHLTRFAAQDLFDTDLSQATVITLYLLPKVNLMLRPRLLRLKPGTRIVSHDWDMGEWPPDRSIEVEAPNKPVGLKKTSRLMLWTVRGDEPAVWRQ